MQESGRATTKTAAVADGNVAAATEDGKSGKKKQVGSLSTNCYRPKIFLGML